jgi:hypothetical protein
MVRALLLAALLLPLSPGAAFGACKRSGVQLYPGPGAVIPLNARMILEGVGPDGARVGRLVGTELVLRASDDVVTVRVLTGWSSAFNRTAVLLHPAGPLKPNKSYTLLIASELPRAELLNGGDLEKVVWHTAADSDTKAPKYLRPPVVTEASHKGDGEQVTRSITLATTLDEESPAYLVVTLRRSRGGAGAQTYFVPVDGDQVRLGHDPCSGNFTFESGRAYQATFEAYDLAGNAGPPLKPIELNAPRRPQ